VALKLGEDGTKVGFVNSEKEIGVRESHTTKFLKTRLE
jgi:hypothetical protein